jgi:hypothetical protein
MPLSKAQRSRINRQNAQKSTGPRTERGKKIASLNSLKHGLCIETLALPGEDAALLRERYDEWEEFYQPSTPAEIVFLFRAVTSSVQLERCLQFQAAAVSKQVRNATKSWDEEREDEVDALVTLLQSRPAAAVRALGRTGHGCRWQIGRWVRLEGLLDQGGGWDAGDRDEAIRLQGFAADYAGLDGSSDGGLTWRINATLNPDCPSGGRDGEQVDVREILMTMHLPMPEPRPEKDAWVHDPAKGLAWLKATIAGHVGALREREERMSREYDEPDRAGAAGRAVLLDGPSGSNLLRYERMYELSFHRAYGAFVKGRKEAAATGVPPGAPVEGVEGDEA